MTITEKRAATLLRMMLRGIVVPPSVNELQKQVVSGQDNYSRFN